MFWTKEINDKVATIDYFAIAITFSMIVEPYLYEYNNDIGHMYKVSYNKENVNQLHRLLKFKVQKRFVVIDKEDDQYTIVGHYDKIDIADNRIVVDLQKMHIQFLN